MRSVLGPVLTAQLARDVAPHLVEWRSTIPRVDPLTADRAALIRAYADRADPDPSALARLQSDMWALEADLRARGRLARASTLAMRDPLR